MEQRILFLRQSLLGVCWFSMLTVYGDDGHVRVASYNLRNYLITNRMVDGHYELDYPKPEAEKAALRAVISAAQADVLAVQEMGTELFLKEFQADLATYGLEYPYVAWIEGEDTVRHLAVLSKIPFTNVRRHRDLDFKYFDERARVKRGLLEVSFGEGDAAWSLYVVHLKSRWTDNKMDFQSKRRRVGEAESIRKFLLGQYNDDLDRSPFLVVGDFNDTSDSSTLRRFLQKSGQSLLQMVATVDSQGENWTFHYRKEDTYQRVDYLLASLPMAERLVEGSAAVVDIQPESRIASDHRLIYADFVFKERP